MPSCWSARSPTPAGTVSSRADPTGGSADSSGWSSPGWKRRPAKPRSHWAATAAYAFSHRLFDALRSLEGAGTTGEIELTDAIRTLIAEGSVAALVLSPSAGEWRSVGSPEGFQLALDRTRQRAVGTEKRSV